MMEYKAKITQFVKTTLQTKAEEMNVQLQAIRNDAGNDGKSSMGDKYETTREMLKQEEEKVATQLEICQKQLTMVSNIKMKPCQKVENGALVRAGDLYFMLLVSLGKIEVEGQSVFVVSAVAPVSRLMLGKSKGERFIFNGKETTIDEIY